MKRLASSLACFGLLAPVLTATSITFVGIESGTTVENWSNTSAPKTHDLNSDDRFGGAGYYQIMPAMPDADFGSSWSVNLDDPNDLGINLPDVPPEGVFTTLNSKPALLVDNPSGGGGSCFIFNTNPLFRNPSGASTLRQGSLAVSITNFAASGPDGIFGSSAKAFTFTLSRAAQFRMGLAVDTLGELGSGAYAPDYVSVSNVNSGGKRSTALNRNGISDMVFFDIEGNEGDEFTVELWQTNGSIGVDGPIAFALVTFDQVPTPTLVYTQSGSNITLSWEQNIPGWILESSTDLGVGDDWDPVPGVVNNSVSVSMTGVPKNFFRLRKDP